jgi:four helix bundle protein
MVRTFWDLEAWQLCDQLRREIEAIIATPDVRRDGKFCDQIRGSIDSACANTAEGFGRYYPAEFRRFLVIARGSLTETQNHLTAALSRKYLSQADFDRIIHLASRAIGANTGLQKYLRERRGVGYPAGDRPPKTTQRDEP